MIITSRQQYFEFFNNKRIALMVFNKDSRNLIRFYNQNLKVINYTINYLIDLTLDYRENLRAKATELINSEKIISKINDLQYVLDNKLIDIIICFDRGYEIDETLALHLKEIIKKDIYSFKECYNLLYDDYKNYKKMSKNAEYNYRWSMFVLDYINIYAVKNKIYVTNAYWEDMFPYENPFILENEKNFNEEYFISIKRKGFLRILPCIKQDFENAKIRLILGSDWGSGKTSFLYNRMVEGNFGIAGDSWFSLVNESFLPLVFMQDFFAVKGIITNEVYRVWSKDSEKEIFIKLDGRLEEYVYGIPLDRRYMIDNLHNYFKQIRFIIILKPDQTISDMQKLYDDFKFYYNITDNLEVYQMSYDGTEKKIKS